MSMRADQHLAGFQLLLQPALCKGCALCIKSCPAQILYLDEHEKIAVQPEDAENECIFCGICEQRCPDFAIWVFKPSQGKKVRDLS